MRFFSLFPAYAGVILALKNPSVCDITFPRIRGGDPPCRLPDKAGQAFSPHTRG